MIQVTHLTTLNNFQLHIQLSNGENGIFDTTPYLNKGIFTELKDISYFSSVQIVFGGIAWPNGQDFSADTLSFELANKIKSNLGAVDNSLG
jgi:hypothetical protein